ncbi:hypothetical protein ACFWH4_16070 [Streptomyces sp. NPDC127091]|uniref:hypothetical protein n=1 Tax=Streptomyces sp. NPDC127091 TaxID=3347134 RepID=UPI003654BE34
MYSRPLSLRYRWPRQVKAGAVWGMTMKPVNPTGTTQPATSCAPLKAAPSPDRTFESNEEARAPAEARDRLLRKASSEGMSLQGHLSHLAETLLTPEERMTRAEQACAALREGNGYDPSVNEQASLENELDLRVDAATAR